MKTEEVYYYETTECMQLEHCYGNWGITCDKNIARTYDCNYRLATSDDLLEYACATGFHIDNTILHCQDGQYIWHEDEENCDYIKICTGCKRCAV